MSAQIQDLATLMRSKREAGQKFILMLGAGASLSSGVKSTLRIMQDLLEKYGTGITAATPEQRFDQLWARTSDDDRELFLKPYLDVEPSSGYVKLAQLIDAGYFDIALTFNFDNLLEEALRRIEFVDYKVMIRGETQDDQLEKLIELKRPRFKITKLHGSLRSSNYFLFDATETYQYPSVIEAFVRKLTGGDIIVCGYAFNDVCVVRAFADQGGTIVCVNPAGAPRNLQLPLKNRRSEAWQVAMDFDTFIDQLHQELFRPAGAQPQPVLNPFKFLESYEEADCGALMGRDEETEMFFHTLDQSPPPQVIVLSGPGRAGKTSLVKAALLPSLDAEKYRGIYLRCQPEIEKSVPLDLSRLGFGSSDVSLSAALQRLGQTEEKGRVVLFLDQFERVTGRFSSATTSGRKELAAYLRDQLFPGCHPNLTLILVVADEGPLGAQLIQECQRQRLPSSVIVCPAFDRAAVLDIIQALAQKGEIDFRPGIVEHMLARYEESQQGSAVEKRFTLAHIQAVCHILSTARQVDYETYEQAFTKTQEALNQAINVCDIISFVEDFAWPEAVWLRNMIKVPLKESKERIAEFIKAHYAELLPVSRPKVLPRSPADTAILELKV